jgi:hypothetical protein
MEQTARREGRCYQQQGQTQGQAVRGALELLKWIMDDSCLGLLQSGSQTVEWWKFLYVVDFYKSTGEVEKLFA